MPSGEFHRSRLYVKDAWFFEFTIQSIFGSRISWSPRLPTVPVRVCRNATAPFAWVCVMPRQDKTFPSGRFLVAQVFGATGAETVTGANMAPGVPELATAGKGLSCTGD